MQNAGELLHLKKLNAMKILSFSDKEFICQQNFDKHGPFWHIATPGTSTEILFTNADEYRFGMTLMAESLYCCDLTAYAFTLMSNHIHVIAGASSSRKCIDFLEHFKSRLSRFAQGKGRNLDLDDFVNEPIPINGLQYLRNNLVYVDRNAYVINSAQTPHSHPWGTAFLYFGYSIGIIPSQPLSDLSLREKRQLTHSRSCVLPDSCTIRNGFVAPESIVDWRTGHSFFRDAHQYFNMLTKNREAYAEFAKIYGDKIVLTDKEMYSAAMAIANKDYQVSTFGDLTDSQRVATAKKMHFDYNASNAQLYRILKVDKALLQELFPEAKQ